MTGRLTRLTSLWPGYAVLEGGTPPTVVVYPSDRAVFRALIGLLESTKEFDKVGYGRRFDLSELTSETVRYAHFQPVDHTTTPDGSTTRDFHATTYFLSLAIQDVPNPEDAADELDRLADVVRNVLLLNANKPYAGFCIPRYSRITKGSLDLTRNPVNLIRLAGQFAYSVDLTTGYLATG